MCKFKGCKGLTLIELVVSMAIFSIVAVAFISLFTSSLVWIYGAGNKGEAISLSQTDIEARIATGEGYSSNDITLKFNSKNYSIRGGLIETTQRVNNRNSNLRTFVPLLPTITLHPIVRYEGDLSTLVTINGTDTHFNSSTFVEIYDATGTVKIGPTIHPTVNTLIKAVFNIPSNLLNKDYIVRVSTLISGKPNEVTRAKYRVEQPKFIAIGEKVYITANGKDWVVSYSLPDITSYTGINDITSNGINYLMVGNSGNSLISVDSAPWIHKSVLGSENISAVTWSAAFNKFYGVGINGGLYSSDSEFNWSSMVSNAGGPLNGITSTSFINLTNIINAVGDNAILYSANGSTWSSANISVLTSNPSTPYKLNSVASSNNMVIAVGENGYMGKSLDGINWNIEEISVHNINDIAYNRDINEFIAVGDNSLILKSSDGITWTTVSSTVVDNFTGIYTQGLELVVVGENGNILYLDNINSLNTLIPNFIITKLDDNLTSVSGK